jgi:hypothetical protein
MSAQRSAAFRQIPEREGMRPRQAAQHVPGAAIALSARTRGAGQARRRQPGVVALVRCEVEAQLVRLIDPAPCGSCATVDDDPCAAPGQCAGEIAIEGAGIVQRGRARQGARPAAAPEVADARRTACAAFGDDGILGAAMQAAHQLQPEADGLVALAAGIGEALAATQGGRMRDAEAARLLHIGAEVP